VIYDDWLNLSSRAPEFQQSPDSEAAVRDRFTPEFPIHATNRGVVRLSKVHEPCGKELSIVGETSMQSRKKRFVLALVAVLVLGGVAAGLY
jgi:hypothetical protein